MKLVTISQLKTKEKRTKKKKKKRNYNERILQIEHGTFTPLVFTCFGQRIQDILQPGD